MTLAEQLKQKGRMEEIQQGMQTGERKTSRKIARAMLKKAYRWPISSKRPTLA